MKLHWFQDEAVASIYGYFQSGKKGNPVIALPTGTGKSLVIANLMETALKRWPQQRFIALTHVKELIAQNSDVLRVMWPNAPIGIYSSGLDQHDTMQPIIFGGVGSVVKHCQMFGHRDLMLIDECHLLSTKDESMYQQVIAVLRSINPHLKVIGFTATAYRMGQGIITDGGLFTDISYDMTGIDGFNRLLAEGFICPLIPKRTNIALDVSNVGMNRGEYAQHDLQDAVDKHDVNYSAVKEMCAFGQDRRSWLVFCSGVEHAEHISEMLNSFGVHCAAVHSKMPEDKRDKIIAAFRAGRLRAIANNNVLTTGFNHPPIDLIGMLRPTMSTVLWVQMLGRGTRPSPGTNKQNCLVLDFARNTQRLGPINDPIIPRKKGEKVGDVPVRICELCGTYNHARSRFCVGCGNEFTFELKITKQASSEELLRSDLPVVEFYDVKSVIYNRRAKDGKPPTIQVSYFCGLQKFDEWICLEHTGFASKKARDWWRQRHWSEPPASTDQALQVINQLKTPRRIRVWVNKPHPEILSYEY